MQANRNRRCKWLALACIGSILLGWPQGFANAKPLRASTPEPEHGGSPCVNACKEPWRSCFRSVCFATPGYEGGSPAKRREVEKLAEQKCQSEWASFVACKKNCKSK